MRPQALLSVLAAVQGAPKDRKLLIYFYPEVRFWSSVSGEGVETQRG